ncbi:hypothetical protein VP01_6090g1 [Puccinia sorghi]|uniref:Uncharacterized protein n=1 Tax=Puccinia sorghi TaxID=27349 RepID=A0A0L6UJ90_9BASI|nr:hypothetical protein VP01_6090g1 [Puccinia sorghi]
MAGHQINLTAQYNPKSTNPTKSHLFTKRTHNNGSKRKLPLWRDNTAKKNLLNFLQSTCRNSQEASVVTPTFLHDDCAKKIHICKHLSKFFCSELSNQPFFESYQPLKEKKKHIAGQKSLSQGSQSQSSMNITPWGMSQANTKKPSKTSNQARLSRPFIQSFFWLRQPTFLPAQTCSQWNQCLCLFCIAPGPINKQLITGDHEYTELIQFNSLMSFVIWICLAINADNLFPATFVAKFWTGHKQCFQPDEPGDAEFPIQLWWYLLWNFFFYVYPYWP